MDFNGTNSLYNIHRDYPLTIRTTWFDRVDNTGPDKNYSLSNLVVPKGTYTKSQMVTWLNDNLPVFSDGPEDPFVTETVYGFGDLLYPPIIENTSTSKLDLFQDSSVLTQIYSGNGANPHVYNSFELVVDVENYRFFSILGWKPTYNVNNPAANFDPIVIRATHLSSTYNAGNDETTVDYITTPFRAPFVYDFSGTRNLYFYLDYPLSSKFRVPFSNCKESNLIGTIPIAVAPFGSNFYYAVQNLSFASQKNITLSNITVSIRDEYDEPVDFNDVPWFLTLKIKFALSEDESMVSATEGTLGLNNSLPSLHPTATSYNNGAGRDILMGSSLKKRKV